jgi:hypothetical protein
MIIVGACSGFFGVTVLQLGQCPFVHCFDCLPDSKWIPNVSAYLVIQMAFPLKCCSVCATSHDAFFRLRALRTFPVIRRAAASRTGDAWRAARRGLAFSLLA